MVEYKLIKYGKQSFKPYENRAKATMFGQESEERWYLGVKSKKGKSEKKAVLLTIWHV